MDVERRGRDGPEYGLVPHDVLCGAASSIACHTGRKGAAAGQRVALGGGRNTTKDYIYLRSGAFGRRGQSLLLGAVAKACRSHRRHLAAWESGPYSPRAGVLRLGQMRTAQVPGPSSQLKA